MSWVRVPVGFGRHGMVLPLGASGLAARALSQKLACLVMMLSVVGLGSAAALAGHSPCQTRLETN